jgi:transposase
MMRVAQDAAIYLHREPVDFRKQINGLAVIVESAMELSPFAAAFYLFRNRRGDQVKVLYWERNGFCVWQKRLEQHRFVWPSNITEPVITLSGMQLNALLDGFDIWRHPPHQRLIYGAVA